MATDCTPEFPQVKGYKILQKLYEAGKAVVYQGRPEGQQRTVAIKLPRSEFSALDEISRLRHEYLITSHLPSFGIVHALALEPWGQGYALVLEDYGGVLLSDYTPTDSWSWPEVLAIALQLAEILHNLHQHQVLHKDIKPSNILIHPQTYQVWLTGFGLASKLPRENQGIQAASQFEGTLAYMAPEQTGRMNRSVDYRADFYALGITLYELLTGQRPFQCDDPMEWVHSHLAKTAPSVHGVNQSVPTQVSAVIQKLIAKNAEDRYQSALGLKHDLNTCLQQWRETGTVEPFELGQRDHSLRFLIPEKLYGREATVQALLDTLERVQQGCSELVLVAGHSGSGKTAVVNEIYRPVTQHKGYFIRGKFDQLNRDVPFSVFAQAFQGLVGQLLGESDAALAAWKARILEAVGTNGRIILEVIPALERIIGEQPPIPELSETAAQNCFNVLFSKFVQVFASPEHPLVIFLDDLQWVDAASLNLLKVLLNAPTAGSAIRNLLVIGAYRNNEVLSGHPLLLTFKELEQQDAPVHLLTLKPLTQSEINHWVADSLRCTSAIATPLSEWVYQKAQGNPFFTAQFLTGLHDDNHIVFDSELGHWHCDLTQVKQRALTNNVVDYLVSRLQKLPQATQVTLRLAACIGNRFDLSILAIVCDRDRSHLASHLWQALRDGLIVPESEAYQLFQVQADGEQREHEQREHEQRLTDLTVSYRFLHDRVQQAAYALIPDSQKPETHYKIGQLLLQHIPTDEQANHIFEIVGQLNKGISILSSQTEQDDLAQLNLTAYQQAKNATAYGASYNYAQTGLSLLGEASAWSRQYDLSLALQNALSVSALLSGEFDMMGTSVATIIEHTESVLEQVPAYLVLIQSKVFRNQRLQAIEIGLKVLEKLGITIPLAPTQRDVEQQLKQVAQRLRERAIPGLISLPIMTNRTALATMQVAMAVTPSAYSVVPSLCPILIALMVEQSIQYGNTGISAFAYSSYGFIACNIFNDIQVGQQFGQLAQEIIARVDARAFESSVAMITGIFIAHRYSHIRDTFPLLRSGYASGLDVGDLESAGINGQLLCQHLFYSGEALESCLSESQSYYNSLSRLHQSLTTRYCKLTISVVLSLQGHSSSPVLIARDAHRESGILANLQSEPDPMGLSYFYIYKLWLCYLFGKVELARSCAEHARESLPFISGLLPEGLFWFLDSLAAMAGTEESDELTPILERVEANQQKLIQYWAHHAPMNYQHKVDLVNAEKYRILGQKSEAIDDYERAIAGAQKNGFIQEEALCHELAAKFYLDWGKGKIAATYLQDAYRCYAEWGAKAKTRELEQRYSHLLGLRSPSNIPLFNPDEMLAQVASPQSFQPSVGQSSAGIFQQSSDAVNQAFDFAAVLKAAQALTETLKLDDLLRKLSGIILQNAGGDRLILALPKSSKRWQVRLVATAETIELCTKTLDENSDVPFQLIQYVKHTREWVSAEHPQTELPVVDDYLLQQQPRSFLCAPLITQDELRGILYVHSSTTGGLITPERIPTLNFLFSQVAIGLKNAQAFEEALTLKSKVIESSLDGMAIAEEGKFIYINQAHVSLFGYEADELLGESWEMLYASSEAQRLIETAFPIVAETGKWSGEATARRKDGRTFAQEVSLFQLDDGKLICVCRDISDRKAAELALKESQARFQRMTENVPGMIHRYVLHTDGSDEMTYVDHRVREIFEVEPEAAIQDVEVLWDRFHPDDVRRMKGELQVSAKTLQPFIVESRLLLPQKGLRWIEIFAAPERLDDGSCFWDGVAIDISDRKATELALQESQDRFQRVAENVPGMIYRYVIHADGSDELTYVSPQVRELFEIEPEVALQDMALVWKRFHPDDIETLKISLKRSAETLEAHDDEFRLIIPNKKLRWIQMSCRPEQLENGDIAWDGVIINISDRKYAEQQLRELSERLELAIDSAQLGIWEWDYQNERLSWDDRMFAIFGVAPQDFQGTFQDWEQCVHPDDLAYAQEGAFPERQPQDGNNLSSKEYRIIHPDGSIRHVLATAVIQWNQQGQLARAIGMNLDITDQKIAEEKLQQINHELEQTNHKLLRATKMKGEFLAKMSHELRTPLNSVIGFSQLLQRDRSLPQQHQETLNTINRSGEYLLELINDILEMSKIESGQITLDFEPVDLHQLLNDLKDSLQIKANNQHLQFNFSYDPQLPQHIEADKVKLRQILLNLLGNALKFTSQGSVTFYAQAITKPLTSEGPVCLQFSVTDTGPGISAEHKETIFQPFVQSSAGKRSHQSIGLGLPISRQLARMMGGDIAVTSVLGQGSTFDCEILATVLAKQTENAVESSKRYGNIRGLKNRQALYRLLVADDNPENRTLLAQILSMPGFAIETVCNGLEAVAMNESWKPDLLWMDIQMPGIDGLEAVRQIRQSPHQPKIVAITANAFSDERDAALAAGCDGFISKPFLINQILEQLEQHLGVEFDREVQVPHHPANSTSTAISEKNLIQDGFKTMPTDWQRALLSSMKTLDSESVRALLTQIPEEQQPMADAMLTLAKDFRYDILLELLEPTQ